MDKLKKNKEVNIVAKEYGRVNVTVPINATDEETEEAAIQAESEGMASFFKREITVLGNNSIQESIKQFTVGKTVYTLSKALVDSIVYPEAAKARVEMLKTS